MKITALNLLAVLSFQLVYPNKALALTTGPSQPEVQSFEPVGTTEMVDLFSGDFVYNIPLMDVEGYPVNISYHGGVNMEQEASWVGLGWNINPGEINRTVRGIPDDFNGDSLKKVLHINDERNVTVSPFVGVETGAVGVPKVSLSGNLGGSLNFSNYKGMSVNLTAGVGVNFMKCLSAGINMGVGSQSGADVDYSVSITPSTTKIISGTQTGIGVGFNSGYNTRSGVKDLNLTISANVSNHSMSISKPIIPIGMKNIVPVITNSSTMKTYMGGLRLGLTGFMVYGYGGVNGMVSNLQYDEEGSRKSYGYFYLENSLEDDVQDFTRDKDGFFNRLMKNLPPGNMTYDVYSVNGQGTGGTFRPFRNDLGSVADPKNESDGDNKTGSAEAGIGNFIEGGVDLTQAVTTMKSGEWKEYKKDFQYPEKSALYENVYFKQAGELTEVDPAYYNQLGGEVPMASSAVKSLASIKSNSKSKRDPRANLISYFTGEEASHYGVASTQYINSYNSTDGFASGTDTAISNINRVDEGGTGKLGRKPYHISEVTQVQKDGRRYVYGIPAVNNIQKEVTFSVPKSSNQEDIAKGLVAYSKGSDDSKGNSNGVDNYYEANYTSTFTHSYLLTSVLSTDYVDVKGDGPSNDDFGTYTKLNYTRKESDFRWKAPFEDGKAQYSRGYISDTRDDKASYVIGSREQWMLHSMESKNMVAEFYTSPRLDAKGVTDAITNSGEGYDEAPYTAALSSAASSYKLDSIKLYNKHDRYTNKDLAIPIKTVYLVYDYSLCRNIPNVAPGAPSGTGKLTLKKIFVKYGNSEKSLISPYQFDYSSFNPDYNLAEKDKWGSYKPNTGTLSNFDFPYVDQTDENIDQYASAWSLTKIFLPSGGAIEVNYESDDYAYVQDRNAAEMFLLKGLGNSPLYQPANQLFFNGRSPNLFAYFKRRLDGENYSIPFEDRYVKGLKAMYFNFATNLVSPEFEPIKGYGGIKSFGKCLNDTTYGYIEFKAVEAKNTVLHPATYTAINVGRFNLPHLMYEGGNPDASNLDNIISGLIGAIDELLGILKGPVAYLVNNNKGKYVDLNKSYLRLKSPGGKRKGGGHRVKSLLFYDNWNSLAGSNANTATYGKQYDYTRENDGVKNGGIISSGVASYEPQAGGDENLFREPIPYIAQEGGNFPPNDPVELYQENPIGESLFPGAMVGYSKVTVTSIHKDESRSGQGIDINEFYTARDFPIRVQESSLEKFQDTKKHGFVNQEEVLKVGQGYSLTFNDMHGKPRKTEHRVRLPKNDKSQLISYQEYIYSTSGGKLNNVIPILKLDPNTGKAKLSNQLVGQEIDIMIDTREKKEETNTFALYTSFNSAWVPIPVPVLVPIVVAYPWDGNYRNHFNSVVTTKVIQQYGVLMQVKSYQEGATTTVSNEAFDPITGQALITSVNNEYGTKEYSLTMPAYWAYNLMGPAYQNIGFTDVFGTVQPYDKPYAISGGTYILPTSMDGNFKLGDEVLVRAKSGINKKVFTAWVVGIDTSYTLLNYGTLWNACLSPIISIRNRATPYIDGLSSTDVLTNVEVKVIRSGFKNQLTESIQSVTALDPVTDGSGFLKNKFEKVVNIKAQEFSSDLNARLNRPDLDTLNDFVNGNFGIHRLHKDYVYLTNRVYKGQPIKETGLFSANSLWTPTTGVCNNCIVVQIDVPHVLPDDLDADPDYRPQLKRLCDYRKRSPLMAIPFLDKNWKLARTVKKYSPWGFELENVDALGNSTAALYRYNNQLPSAVAQNAKQQEILSEDFEDFSMLQVKNDWIKHKPSDFLYYLTGITGFDFSKYCVTDVASSSYINIVNTSAHTGLSAMEVIGANDPGTSTFTISIPCTDTEPIVPKLESTKLISGKNYILSYWYRPSTTLSTTLTYDLPPSNIVSTSSGAISTSVVKKSNIINGWQQVEVKFTAPSPFAGPVEVKLPLNILVDDMRIFPIDGNMKSFVHNPVNQRLAATLDENNYATFYEYDQEGNLVRTKRETERGIITLSESRSANPKAN